MGLSVKNVGIDKPFRDALDSFDDVFARNPATTNIVADRRRTHADRPSKLRLSNAFLVKVILDP